MRIKWCDSYRVARDLEGVDGPQRVRRVSEGVMPASERVVIFSEWIFRTSIRVVRP